MRLLGTACSVRLLFCCLRERCHRDKGFVIAPACEGNMAFDQCKNRVILAKANAFARVHFRAALTNNDVARNNMFAAKLFDAKIFWV